MIFEKVSVVAVCPSVFILFQRRNPFSRDIEKSFISEEKPFQVRRLKSQKCISFLFSEDEEILRLRKGD
jgi:hypothetical protein